MYSLYARFLAAFVLITGLAAASAAEPPGGNTDVREAIAKKFPGVKPRDVRPSPINGIYEVPLGADTAYVSSDGRYIIAGDLYEIDTRRNLTEVSRAEARVRMLAKVDERDMIVFTPASVKHTITVFTDVDCGYCRKLHGHVDDLTKLGVKVRYLAYPRGGPGSAEWRKMEAVWCSNNRNASLTRAKLGEAVKTENCGATPVAGQFDLGGNLGVQGTPAIFTAEGEYIGGYLSPEDMLRRLEKPGS